MSSMELLPFLPPSCSIVPSSDNKSSRLVQQKIRSLSLARPKAKYNVYKKFFESQYGRVEFLPALVSSSLSVVRRFDLVSKLSDGGHIKGVNSVSFGNFGGRVMLLSASDDLRLVLWDPETRKAVMRVKTQHEILVTCARLLEGGQGQVVSSCYDGQVRLCLLGREESRLLVQHRGSVHRISRLLGTGGQLLSAGEDGQVFLLDPRCSKPCKILFLENRKGLKVPIYSVMANPANHVKFCLSGRDQYLRIFDVRSLKTASATLSPPCLPDGVETGPNMAVFGRTGRYTGTTIIYVHLKASGTWLSPMTSCATLTRLSTCGARAVRVAAHPSAGTRATGTVRP